MPTAEIQFPAGQHVVTGKHIDVLVKYTGSDPQPNDIHIFVREGSGSWTPSSGFDIPSGVDPRSGVPLSHPAGNQIGTFGLRIDWSWKPDRQDVGSDQGQYFVDPPPLRPDPPLDTPDEDGEPSSWWKWLLFVISGPAELALLILYGPFWALKLAGFDSWPGERLKDLIEWIRDNLLPPPFDTWGKK